MKFNKYIALVAFAAVVLTSCKNDLNIQAPYKDITVVYGLIDQNDPIHYIRINKGFEGSGNAYSMAQQYDSIYYPVNEINAVLQDSNSTNGNVVNIPLDTTTTVPLSPGTFAYPKQLLYYTNKTLNPNDIYNLLVTNTITGKKIRGSTSLLQDIVFTYPANLSTYSFFNIGSEPYPTAVTWYSTSNASIYQMSITFYYDNQFGSGPKVQQTPLQLILAQQTSSQGGTQISYNVSEQDLFALIIANVKPIAGVTRYVDSLAIIFTSGTSDLNTYIQLSQPPEGINQDVPSFSDLTNGIGLYTARHVQTYYRKVDASTMDSLTQEARFVNLGFVP